MTMQQSNAEAGRVRRYNLSTLSVCPPSSLMQPIRNPDFTGDSGCLGRDATPRFVNIDFPPAACPVGNMWRNLSEMRSKRKEPRKRWFNVLSKICLVDV